MRRGPDERIAGGMAGRLRIRDVRAALPDLDEVHRALDLLLSASEADLGRASSSRPG